MPASVEVTHLHESCLLPLHVQLLFHMVLMCINGKACCTFVPHATKAADTRDGKRDLCKGVPATEAFNDNLSHATTKFVCNLDVYHLLRWVLFATSCCRSLL